jgi:hypothetical protein
MAPGSSLEQLPGCGSFETLTLHDGLGFDEPSCDCGCGPPVCEATIGYYGNNTCTGSPSSAQGVSTGCAQLTSNGAAAKWASTAECAPITTKDIPDPTWQNHLRLCSIFAAGSADDSCAPAPTDPFQPPLCIVREGAGHTCPPGYDDVIELYYDYNDTRDCTPECSCSAGMVECSGALHTHSTANCTGGTATPWAEANCITSFSFAAVSYVLSSTGGSCTSNSAEGIGTVTATNPFTVCCTPY